MKSNRLFIAALFIVSNFLFSCHTSNSRQGRNSATMVSKYYTEELNVRQTMLNDSLITFINSTIPASPISIGNHRVEILNKLKATKEELIEFCGGYNETGGIDISEMKLVQEFFVKQKRGIEVQNIVNSITEYTNEHGLQLPRIAREANEIETLKNDTNQSYKTFTDFSLAHVNLAEALNIITVYEALVLQAESAYLNDLLIKKMRNDT